MIAERQRALNRATETSWDLFTPHRRRVTELALVAPRGAAAILGAGNCNDVDLAALAGGFDALHLLDVDGDALRRAVARQPPEVAAKITIHEGVDLSGFAAPLAAWGTRSPSRDDVEAAACNLVRGVTLPVRDASLVLSTCVLTQMILAVVDRLGPKHPACLDLVRAIRVGHTRTMVSSLAPGGLGVFVTDVVSSDTAPWLANAPAEGLRDRMMALVAQKNFFTGANPFLIEAAMKDGALGAQLHDVTLHDPWVWPIAARRHYLVTAISARRRVDG